ncbi:hypothetical protein [Haloarchaeobius salinus]|uniref:hypothetical protein n=1 Tax=Haloarchaeobius salinus TaxID=1198298 RepID=UPI00210E9B97|nr:hypothetical protein [Haloarchaeobius salinus]
MGWFAEQIKQAIESIIGTVTEQIGNFLTNLIQALIQRIVGVPHPLGDRYIVIGRPSNGPWSELYSDVYLTYILPLTFAFLFIGFAYIGVRSGSISPYRRKKLLRRAAMVFMGSFVWFPAVSLPLHFINDIGMVLAPVEEMTSSFEGGAKAVTGGVFIMLIIYFVENSIVVIAALVYALRWLGIIVLTLTMPLLGAFWAFDIWPLSPVSRIAKRAAAVYPGLLLAGLPAAVLFRMGWEMNLFSLDASTIAFNALMALMLIPGACIASVLTIYWSSPMIQRVARKGTGPATRAASSATSTAHQTAKRGAQGAVQVHRDLAQKPLLSFSRSNSGSGDSGRRSGSTPGSSNATPRSGRTMQQDVEIPALPGRVSEDSKDSSKLNKEAFKRTKRKVSRWRDR